MQPSRLCTLVACLTLFAGALRAEDTVPNPEFANWSKFKKGTSVTHKSTSEVMGITSEVVITTTLVESGADKLVLESTSVAKVNGKDFKPPPFKRDVAKTVPIAKGLKKEEFTAGKPPGTSEEGAETLKIAGIELKTKWYKYAADVNNIKSEGKSWMSDEVPGMLVKSEITTSGTIASKMKMELVEIKKP